MTSGCPSLGPMTWPAVGEVAATTLLALPLGSTEQHGPHLPVSTDTMVAVALAERLATARADVIVAPPMPYGSSGEHAPFPGTLSIGQTALELVVVELIRSADAFAGVVVVSAHGGNAEPLGRATATLVGEGRRVLAWSPRPTTPTDAHAGRTETSLMLALAPATVRVDAAAAGNRRPIGELVGALRAGGVAAVSANGVLGDPEGASRQEGLGLLDAWAADLVSRVEAWA